MPNQVAARDGTVDFSSGVNSIAVTTLASDQSPGGLKRSESAWIINGSCRDGGITTRAGWLRIAEIFSSVGLFQGMWFYRPVGAFPYLMAVVSGNILRIDPDTGAVINLSAQFGLLNNATEPFAYYAQAEEFAVFQSGDDVTLPLIWDGSTLRRSNGITGNIGQPSATIYNIYPTDFFTIPSVGNTVVVSLNAIYPGGLADQGTLRGVGSAFDIGTFTVMAFTAVAPFTVTLRTDASNWIGHTFPPISIFPAGYQFTLTAIPTPVLINEIPAATAMCYYMERLWYAQGRVVSAGDLVFGPSGTAAYGLRDSVLKVTENPLAIGGDGFIVPSQDGNIRALQYGANIDAALGQGRLFVFTIKAIYALQVPVSREDWINAGQNNQPLMTVVQLANGSVNDRSVTPVNGDLFYQSLEPGIRSLMQSMRSFTQWANTSLSANENRILQFNDRSLLRAGSGMFFSNRVWQTCLPRQTPQGIVHDAIVPLDVLPVSTFDQQRRPNWEGSYEGIPVFQMAVADFGGRERAFAMMRADSGALELWELTTNDKFDYATELSDESRRIVMQIETPAWTWSGSIGELELKKLVATELWVDRLFGTVEFTLEYRPDGALCWIPWIQWKECSPKSLAEISSVPPGYLVPLGECYKATMVTPKPPENCAPCGTGRPAYIGYQFQGRLTIRGFCRLRGFWFWAEPVERPLYEAKAMVC